MTTKESKWIKCSERIPDLVLYTSHSKSLLLYLPDGSDGISSPLIEKGFFSNTLGNCIFCLPFSRVETKMVTHYMELPEPPEDE